MSRTPVIGVMGTGANAVRSVAKALGGEPAPRSIAPLGIAPTIDGGYGRAWLIDIDAWRARLGRSDDAMIAQWIVEAPFAHPIWHSYFISLIHLRPMADGRPTKFYVDGATHEIWVYALNPDVDRAPLIRDATGLGEALLSPINFAAQFIEIEDHLAVERGEQAVRDICHGRLSPDTDWRKAWAARFGSNMMK